MESLTFLCRKLGGLASLPLLGTLAKTMNYGKFSLNILLQQFKEAIIFGVIKNIPLPINFLFTSIWRIQRHRSEGEALFMTL